MEGLIVALIIMAIGTFFGNKKKEETSNADFPKDMSESNQSNGQHKGQRTLKRAEDYAQEVYSDFQDQLQERPEEQQELVQKAEQKVRDLSASRRNPTMPRENLSGRLSAHQNRPKIPEKEEKDIKQELFPLSQSEAQKGIILSEIFMPPKSKR